MNLPERDDIPTSHEQDWPERDGPERDGPEQDRPVAGATAERTQPNATSELRRSATRKRPPRPRSSRLRASHCKNCKADHPEPRYVLGIGEMCPECAGQFKVIGELVEAIDGQVCGDRPDLFRAMVRAVQQLNFEYAVVGEGDGRKLQLGRALYRPQQMLEVYNSNSYQYDVIMQAYLKPHPTRRK